MSRARPWSPLGFSTMSRLGSHLTRPTMSRLGLNFTRGFLSRRGNHLTRVTFSRVVSTLMRAPLPQVGCHFTRSTLSRFEYHFTHEFYRELGPISHTNFIASRIPFHSREFITSRARPSEIFSHGSSPVTCATF